MLKTAEANVALQSRFWKAVLEKMDTLTAEIAELQERLVAKGAELSQLSAKHSELTDKLVHVNSQSAAGYNVQDDQKSVAGTVKRFNKRVRVARQRKKWSITPSSTAFPPYWLNGRSTRITVKP